MQDGRITDEQIALIGFRCFAAMNGMPGITCNDYLRLFHESLILNYIPQQTMTQSMAEVDLVCPHFLTGIELLRRWKSGGVNEFNIIYSLNGHSWHNIRDACTNETKVRFCVYTEREKRNLL